MFNFIKALFSFNWETIKLQFALFNAAYVDYPAAMNLNALAIASNINGVTIASAATITLTTAISYVSGTTNVTAIKVPTGFRGLIVIIPTGALPLVSGGTYVASDGTYETLPIKVSKTCTANVPVLLVSDGLFLYAILSA